jgi:hypothetical protein
VIEGALGKRFQRMAGAAGVGDIRHKNNVVIRGDLDAALGKNLPGEFKIVPDLQHSRIFKQWLEDFERFRFGNLIGSHIAAE